MMSHGPMRGAAWCGQVDLCPDESWAYAWCGQVDLCPDQHVGELKLVPRGRPRALTQVLHADHTVLVLAYLQAVAGTW